MHIIRALLFITGILTLFPAASAPQRAAIASAHPMATAAGHRILDEGGNAYDAAIAVAAVLAVVEPYSAGLGGGGFWLLHRASDRHEAMIDSRETAPLAATRDMYLDASGKLIPGLSINGPMAAGIPGVPAAMVYLARNYGRLPLSQSLQPAIEAAEQGFAVDEHYRRLAGFRLSALRASKAARRIFLQGDEVPAAGYLLRQPELAKTLGLLAKKGIQGFYTGAMAERLVTGVRDSGGIWSLEDLANYVIKVRRPVEFRYRDMRVVSAAPPSSGGVALATMLNILAGYELAELDSVARAHLVVESMRRAYRDRAQYLGDADFVPVPVERLTGLKYADDLRSGIENDRATPSSDLPGIQTEADGPHTTHFSILDRNGNRVSATLSINYPFGSGFVVPGTGVLLNDEMDDFSALPGSPNAYGLVGAEANAIAPGKRMLSSMTPTFLETSDRMAIIGTPGGSRIITMVLLGTLAFYSGADAEAIVRLPRFHHQYLPDRVQLEPSVFSAEDRQRLQALGHRLEMLSGEYGNMQVVIWNRKSNRVEAASDPRGIGGATVR